MKDKTKEESGQSPSVGIFVIVCVTVALVFVTGSFVLSLYSPYFSIEQSNGDVELQVDNVEGTSTFYVSELGENFSMSGSGSIVFENYEHDSLTVKDSKNGIILIRFSRSWSMYR